MNKLGVLSTNIKTAFMRRLMEEVGDATFVLHPHDEFPPECTHLLVRTSGYSRDDQDLNFIKRCPASVKIINPTVTLEIFRSKNSQYSFFETHRVPHLPWFDLSEGKLPENLFPGNLLVKPRRGFGGWGVRKLSHQEFRLWWESQVAVGDIDYLVQPFAEEAIEYRIFFAGEFRFKMERTNQSGITANLRTGGEAKKSSLPSEVMIEMESLIKLSGAWYGAIDLLINRHGFYVLELNVVPGIEQVEALSGRSIIREILRFY